MRSKRTKASAAPAAIKAVSDCDITSLMEALEKWMETQKEFMAFLRFCSDNDITDPNAMIAKTEDGFELCAEDEGGG